MAKYTLKEWQAEGRKRFGDMMNWKFKCPMCGHVASIQEFKDVGAKSPDCAYTECIGRYKGKGSPEKGDSSGCNWCAYGLFGIPNDNFDIVITPDGREEQIFCFADCGEE